MLVVCLNGSNKKQIMEKITMPTIKLLAKGEKFNAKQMKAKAGELLPEHIASIESVVIMLEGECVLSLSGTDHVLTQGDAFVVPPKIKHQIIAVSDFKAVHVMTNDITFEFFK